MRPTLSSKVGLYLDKVGTGYMGGKTYLYSLVDSGSLLAVDFVWPATLSWFEVIHFECQFRGVFFGGFG